MSPSLSCRSTIILITVRLSSLRIRLSISTADGDGLEKQFQDRFVIMVFKFPHSWNM